MTRIIYLTAAAIVATTVMAPVVVAAEPVAISATREDTWQYGAFIYGYYPNINSKATFRNGQGVDATVDASDIFNNLKFGFLGSFEARKGQWGMFTDVMYLNVGAFKSQVRNFEVGQQALPADVSASANFNLKTVVWTLAATYRAIATKDGVLDVFAGARLLDIKESLDWTLNGNIAQIPAPGRAGSQSIKNHNIDAVVGLKGRAALGRDMKWFIPYYADIGTGDSDLTWQAMTGLGYAFTWGEVMGGWRYLDYQFKSDAKIDSMNLTGPLLGVAFHW